jgi:hypothetical protein
MTYTHGHHESVLRSHKWRTVDNSAAYLAPHLTTGISVLDLGRGPARSRLTSAGGLRPDVMGTDQLGRSSGSSTPTSTTVDMQVLNRFGEASGGRAWEISEAAFGKNMNAVLDTIAAELRSQYSIG